MTLTKYRQKRKFHETPEPKGHVEHSKKQLKFVIQKHDASHLHYDFRLELDGVLVSWAIPKGPSLNPKDRRLAMHVEDHPLDYRTFEGEIPKGNYGAGEVIVWDEGIYYAEPNATLKENTALIQQGLKKGKLKFTLEGQKLNGAFSLVKMHGREENSWLLIKDHDKYVTTQNVLDQVQSVRSDKILSRDGASYKQHASKKTLAKSKTSSDDELEKAPKYKSSGDITPMLATLVDESFDKAGWIFEIKWDGYRAVSEIKKNKVKLYSRNHKNFIEKFPVVAKALKNIDRDVILDGEIVALDDHGNASFQALQDYQNNQSNLVYYVFDIIACDGKDLQKLPLVERKSILKSILPDIPEVRYSDHVEETGEAFFEAALKEGLEGIMAKDGQSPYLAGKRTEYWLKIKTHHQQEAVICGYTKPRGSRKDLGALILGVFENNKLKYIGHTGTGFNTKSLSMLKKKLSAIETKTSPFEKAPKTNMPVTWVKPSLVCQVRFQEWTKDGRMRQPVFLGLREDKKPKEVLQEPEKSPSEVVEKKADKTKTKSKSTEITNVKLTHLDKIYFPEKKLTKGDLLSYYDAVSDLMLPYLKDRPMVLNRFPNGIHGSHFYQKDFDDKLPDFVETVEVYSESNDKDLTMVLCQNKETLLYLSNMGCIEHNPWSSRKQKLHNPDYLIIDLDPDENEFDKVVETALTVKEVLDEIGAEAYCKTSGATGLHIFVPLGTQYNYDSVREFAHLIVALVHKRLPSFTSLERSPKKRKGKIYLDYLQNSFGQTIASVYSVRPNIDARVSTPLTWDEVVPGLHPSDFTLETIYQRLEDKGDIWKPAVFGKGINMQKCLKKLEE